MATLVEQRDALTKKVASLEEELAATQKALENKKAALKSANASLAGKTQSVTDQKNNTQREIKARDKAIEQRDEARLALTSVRNQYDNATVLIDSLQERVRLALEAIELGLHLYHPELYEGQKMSGNGPVESPRARLQLRVFDILNRNV